MEQYIEMYNLFFQDQNKYKNLKLPANIKQWASKHQIGTKYLLGVIDNQQFKWIWTIPTLIDYGDLYNENIGYKYLNYGTSIFKKKSNYFQLYTRYILTKSDFKLNETFDIITFLSVLNNIKNKDNTLLILKFKKSDLSVEQINHSKINLDDNKYYYKIYEIPKKIIN
jgi:hypothetical protein